MKYIVIALGVLLLTSCLSTWYFYHEYQAQVKATQTYKDAVGELERNDKIKDADIKLANDRIDEFVKAGKVLEDKGIAAQKQASVLAKKNDGLAIELSKWKPKDGENVCVASDRLINEYLDKRKTNEVSNPSY